jgi:hypothetical protein
MKALSPSFLALLFAAVPAFADVTVTLPASNATVPSPFVLTAAASPCASQPVSAMGYSIDAGSTTIIKANSVNAQLTATTGSHILHVKSWGNAGASCSANVNVTVSASAPAALYTDVAVAQPTGQFKLVSPFTLVATGTQCKSQPIGAMGFSIDDSSNTTIVNGGNVNAQVTSLTGTHTLHVKSWGNAGASCVNDVTVNVVPDPATMLPATAIAVKNIETLTNWISEFDAATTGSTNGTTALVGTPSLTGTSRQFITTSTNNGGHRYHNSFGADIAASNFLYDARVYIANDNGNIANLEFDMNQVTANGQTVIYGFQCDSWSKTWDYTANSGTPTAYNDVWLHSNQSCNVANWTPNTWHHLQVAYSRDNAGNVTYQSVWLDGVEQDLNVTVNSSFALGWGSTLLTNFQVDGKSGTATTTSSTDIENLTVYRW